DPEKVAIVSSNVTLAVTPDEAQVLSLAGRMGELRLSLRSSDDVEKTTIRPMKPEDIRLGRINSGKAGNGDEEPGGKPLQFMVPPVELGATTTEPPPEPVKPKKPWSVTLINSDQVTKILFPEEDGEYSTVIQKTEAVQPTPKKKSATPAGPEGDK